MAAKTVHFGIIGCGRIAPRHGQSLAQLETARLISVADIISHRAENFAKEFGAEACTDYRYLLDDKRIDVINICTPSGMHAHMAIEAMHAGKDVVCEKPMALTLEDADAMIATAHSTGRKLCIVLQNRYNPPMQDLRRAVDAGKLGRLLLGNATVRWYRPQEYYEDGWHGTLAMDGGALMNQSIHHIDALQWFMGDVESVFAFSGTLAHKMEAEDTGVAVIRFKNGALGSVEGSTITYPQNLEGSVALFGEKGSIKIGGTALNRKVIWKVEGELEHEREMLAQEQLDPPSVYGSSHTHVLKDMLRALEEDRDSQTNGYEGRRSLALVLAIYQSARTQSVTAFDHSPFASHSKEGN
jgi:predicted dehydrogenase